MIRFILLLIAVVLGNFLYVTLHYVPAPIPDFTFATVICVGMGVFVNGAVAVGCVLAAVFCSDKDLP